MVNYDSGVLISWVLISRDTVRVMRLTNISASTKELHYCKQSRPLNVLSCTEIHVIIIQGTYRVFEKKIPEFPRVFSASLQISLNPFFVPDILYEMVNWGRHVRHRSVRFNLSI